MRLKVHGGTPPNDRSSLCDTCRHARITRGRTLDEEIVGCNASPMRPTTITFKVTSCSEYSDQTMPSYWDLLQQAWILQPASRKRPAGFVRATDLQDQDFDKYILAMRKRGDRG